MLKLSQILKATSRARQRRADSQCRVRLSSATMGSDKDGLYKQVLLRVVATTVPRYVTIRLYPDRSGEYSADSPAWVHCSCQDTTYRWEVSLSSRGSSDVINSNGNYPIIRNPRLKPSWCKHGVAAAPVALAARARVPKRVSKDEFREALRELGQLGGIIPETETKKTPARKAPAPAGRNSAGPASGPEGSPKRTATKRPVPRRG